jgi:hypothetical protein
MRRCGVVLIGLWIALGLLIAVLRQIGPWIDPPVDLLMQRSTSLPAGFYSFPHGVPVGQVIAAWGPPESIASSSSGPNIFLDLYFVTPRVMLIVKGRALDPSSCTLVRPDDEVEIAVVESPDQPPAGKVYYPPVQPWVGFTRYCFE